MSTADYIDLNFRGAPRVIATAVLAGPDGLVVIDPGPTSCLPALEAGLRDRGGRARTVGDTLAYGANHETSVIPWRAPHKYGNMGP